MGGRVAVVLAAQRPELVSGLILVDAPLAARAHKEELLARHRRPTRIYDAPDEAVRRWVSLPPQPGTLSFVRDRVARESLRSVEGGWTWKFDPAMFGNASDLGEAPDRVRCPLVLLRCESGILSPARIAEAQERLDGRLTVLELPGAGHHPMLDQPLLLVGVLRAVIALGRPAPARVC
jgi:pimeloyl-ACP methyl ester carboxylesterase